MFLFLRQKYKIFQKFLYVLQEMKWNIKQNAFNSTFHKDKTPIPYPIKYKRGGRGLARLR